MLDIKVPLDNSRHEASWPGRLDLPGRMQWIDGGQFRREAG
jgi:hypothetical protein